MTSPNNFLSSRHTFAFGCICMYLIYNLKYPDPKSGRDLVPDKLGCVISCHRGVTDHNFSRTFSLISVLNP